MWVIIGAVVVVVLAVVVVALRDKHENDAPVSQTEPAQVEVAAAPSAAPEENTYEAAQAAFLADNIKKPGWKATSSGLQYHVLKAVDDPAAPKPEPGSVVTVNYEGTMIDGKVFDSSYQRGEPISFPLTNVIEGWQEGVPMMKVGETWEFAIPSDLAYGPANAGPIPAGSALIFKIELLKANTPATP